MSHNIQSSLDLDEIMSSQLPSGSLEAAHLCETFTKSLDSINLNNESNILIILCFSVESVKSELDILKSKLLLRPVNVYTTLVSFSSSSIYSDDVIVDENDEIMNDLVRWSRRVPRLSIVNDYKNEMEQLMRLRPSRMGQRRFTFDDYTTRALLSSVDSSMNNLVDLSCCCIIL